MTLSATCGNCKKEYRVDEKFAGRQAACKQCGAPFIVPALASSNSSVTPPAIPAPNPNIATAAAPPMLPLDGAPDDARNASNLVLRLISVGGAGAMLVIAVILALVWMDVTPPLQYWLVALIGLVVVVGILLGVAAMILTRGQKTGRKRVLIGAITAEILFGAFIVISIFAASSRLLFDKIAQAESRAQTEIPSLNPIKPADPKGSDHASGPASPNETRMRAAVPPTDRNLPIAPRIDPRPIQTAAEIDARAQSAAPPANPPQSDPTKPPAPTSAAPRVDIASFAVAASIPAFAAAPGWYGHVRARNSWLAIASVRLNNPALNPLRALVPANVIPMVVAIDNTLNDSPLTIDLASIKLIENGAPVDILDLSTVLKADAPDREALLNRYGSIQVPAHGKITDAVIFVPVDTDLVKLRQMAVDINGNTWTLRGDYKNTQTKAGLVKRYFDLAAK